MQETTQKYKEILMKDHWFEHSLAVGTDGRLVDERGNLITFGGFGIYVDDGGANGGFKDDSLISVYTTQQMFPDEHPTVGNASAAEIDVEMIAPLGYLPRRCRITPYVRAVSEDPETRENEYSEWIQQGMFYVDTRQQSVDGRGLDILTVHGYDAMILADDDYPSGNVDDYPMLDIDMVKLIAKNMRIDKSNEKDMGISLDQRTTAHMNRGYKFNLPIGYSMREVLRRIAASYGGNFIISPVGELRLVLLSELPKETRFLIDNDGFQLIFGNDPDGDPWKWLV